MQSGRRTTEKPNSLRLTGPVGPGRRNDPDDLRRVRAALSTLGWLPGDEETGAAAASGFDGGLQQAIQQFQSDNGLEPDGRIAPDGGTVARLRYRLKDRGGAGESGSDAGLRASSEPSRILRPPLRKAGSVTARAPKPRSRPAWVRDEGVRTPSGTVAPPPEQNLAYDNYTDHRLVDPDSYSRPFDVASRDTRLFTDSSERRRSIVDNTPGLFNIQPAPQARPRETVHRLETLGINAIRDYGPFIDQAAERHSVDPDLIRAIMFIETAHGYYDTGLAAVGAAKTIRPMNVHTEFWADFISDRDPSNPEDNIDIAAQLLRRIIDRLEAPTVAKVATIYHSLGRERVSGYGVDVAYYYNRRIWEVRPTIEEILPSVP